MIRMVLLIMGFLFTPLPDTLFLTTNSPVHSLFILALTDKATLICLALSILGIEEYNMLV